MFTICVCNFLTLAIYYDKMNCPKWDNEVYMDKLQLLKKLFLFNNVDFDELDRRYSVFANITEIEYDAGDIILSTDEKPVGIGIVSSG